MRRDMRTLKERTHYVGAKADGTRAFMVLESLPHASHPSGLPYVAFVGRRGTPRYIQVKGVDLRLHIGTVVDGELVKTKEGGEYFLAFDLIALGGETMTNKHHSTRLSALQYVINNLKSTEEKLCIMMKPWFRYTPDMSFKSVRGSIAPLPCDGLVFVPERGTLHPGSQRDHFKWKSAHQHTVDLLVNPDMTLWLGEQGSLIKAGIPMHIHPHLSDVPDVFEPINPTIVECSFQRTVHSRGHPWVPSFVRIRTDKKYPNDIRTAKLTLQNIEEDIRVTELMLP